MNQNRFKIVKDWKEIKQLVEYCKQTKYCSLDFETSGGSFATKTEYPTIIGISFQIGSSYIIPLGHTESIFSKEYKKVLKYLSNELFENPEIIKIAWNLKFEHKWLMQYGCNFEGRIFDAMLAKYLLDEERPNDLKSMVAKYLPDFASYEDGAHTIANKVGWANVPLKELSTYCALDCDLTLRLMMFFEKKLIKAGLYHLYRNLIMQASVVLAESEFAGIPINVKYLDNLIIEYGEKIEINEKRLMNHKRLKKFERIKRKKVIKQLIENTKKEIEDIEDEGKPNAARLIAAREAKISRYVAGEFTNNKEKNLVASFNFNSQKQVVELFYTANYGFKFPILKYTTDKFKRQTDNPSTDEETLIKLKDYDKSGFLDRLLTHRELTKLHSTYMVGIRNHLTADNRVHGDFFLHGTVTGRLSSREPNLQNIPRGDTPEAATIKKMFKAPKGYVILQMDYAQAELRVIAEMANETSMIEAFANNIDIHIASACKKYKVDPKIAIAILKDEKHKDYPLWKKRRKQAKTINFGIVFCQGASKLAISLSEPAKDGKPAIVVSKWEAQVFLDEFNRDFPRIAKFMKSQQKFARENGYVRNLFGRKRRLANIYSPVDGVRMEAERQAVNAPVQGTASDFALFSSVLIRERKLQAWHLTQIYTVHDSLGFLIKPQFVHDAVKVLNGICENPETKKYFGFEMKKVRMSADFEVGIDWGSLSKYDTTKDYTKI